MVVKMAASVCQLATKLRLAITSVNKKSGILDEKGLPEPERNSTLFGVNVLQLESAPWQRDRG